MSTFKLRLFTASQGLHDGEDMKIIYKTVKPMNVIARLLSQNKNKNLAIANRSRVSCAHNSSRASPCP